MQTVLQLSKIIKLEETFMEQLIHKVEVVQFQVVEKVNTWLKSLSLWSNIENLL